MHTEVNNAVIKAQNLLNTVSQDSTVMASLLVEDSGFYDLLCTVISGDYTAEQAYDSLISYVNANF